MNNYDFFLENNQKVIEGIKEFIRNERMNRIFLNCADYLTLETLSDFARKNWGANFYMHNAKDIKSMMNCFRASVNINLKSFKSVYEGEISEIKIARDETGEVIGIDITLKTCKMSKNIHVNKYLYDTIKDISIGDVIYAEPSLGIIKRIGRSENKLDEYDLEGDKYVQLSKGPVCTVKVTETSLTLYDVDCAYNGYSEDITFFTRKHVDDIINEYSLSGIIKIEETILFIEDCQYLNYKQITDLFKLSEYFPSVKIILAGDALKMNSLISFDNVFKLNIKPENIAEIARLICPKLEIIEFKNVVFPLINRSNFNLILSILQISESPSEFLDYFNLQSC